ncbi:MAG: protein adenylyltransferase SelO family protein, partial [Pseudomonadales bacterium]
TGEPVYRETALPGAVLTRVAASHIRVGTFQYIAARGDTEAIRTLADHVIERHYPEVAADPAPYLVLLRAFADRQAMLIARWLGVGFIHGVMNTDNVSVAGETIDFGPCAFMDEYHPDTVFSSIDQMGRYAYERQPHIAQWNLARFAETLLPLLADDQERAVALATEVVSAFSQRFEACWIEVMAGKLGLRQPCAADGRLVRELLGLMREAEADFTLTFRPLAGVIDTDCAAEDLNTWLPDSADRDDWLARWRSRLATEGSLQATATRLRETNPAYIPRNHRVEQMIEAAVTRDDFSPFERLLDVLSSPFQERPEHAAYGTPPKPHERVTQTFCGT